MRKTIAIVVTLALVWIGYTAWPLSCVFRRGACVAHEASRGRLRSADQNQHQSVRAKHGRRCLRDRQSNRAKTDFPRSTVRAAWYGLAGNRGFRSTAGHGRDSRAHDWHHLAAFQKFGIRLCPLRSGGAIRAAAAATLSSYLSA